MSRYFILVFRISICLQVRDDNVQFKLPIQLESVREEENGVSIFENSL